MPSLPKDFCTRIIEQYENGQDLLDGLKTPPTHSVLHNPRKSKEKITKPVAWNDHGEYLDEPASYFADPWVHAGVYYPQEASSMFLGHVLKNTLTAENPVCLDMCAAPGGSSLMLQSHLNGKGLLVSNEVISKRNFTLQESLAKWGYSNKVVIQAKADSVGRLGPLFDFMLIDAPSSIEARFRANHNTRETWKSADVAESSTIQREIVDNAKWGLKTGGILVYATNTFAQEENEDIVARLCSRGEFEAVDIPLEADWNIERPVSGAYQFFPHKAEGEGYFMTVLRRVKEVRPASIRAVKIPTIKLPGQIKLNDGLVAIRDKQLHAFPEQYLSYLHHLSQVKMHSVGTTLGESKGPNFFPDHEVALALQISHEFPTVEISMDQAMAYFKKDTFTIDGPKGWVVLALEGHPLGWAKNLGSRINNHYPTHWRIRS